MRSVFEYFTQLREAGVEQRIAHWSAAGVGLALLGGCAAGSINSVELDPTQATVCDTTATPPVCGVPDNQPTRLIVHGTGLCSVVLSQCGNGTGGMPFGLSQDFAHPPPENPLNLQCNYRQSYPGPKTVTVHSNGSDCIGAPTLKLRVLTMTNGAADSILRLGYGQPTPTACTAVPSVMPLRKGTVVNISNIGAPNAKIDFGCLLGGCVYDANGEPNSSAPSGFPFPTLRKYSLVLRVGTQVVQGGTSMSFTTTQGGPLKVCVNDDQLGDNSGGWGIGIAVDESMVP